MCEPATIIAGIGAAVSIGSTVAGAIGQSQASEENKRAAKDALRTDLVAIGRQQAQEKQVAAQTIMQADRQAREADALARVSAGEAGVAGASVDALLGDIERERLEYGTAVELDSKAKQEQLELEKRGAGARAQNRINAVPGPDPLGLALRIGGTVADFGAGYISRLPKVK